MTLLLISGIKQILITNKSILWNVNHHSVICYVLTCLILVVHQIMFDRKLNIPRVAHEAFDKVSESEKLISIDSIY